MYLMLLTYIIALAVILSNFYTVFFAHSELNWFCYLTCSILNICATFLKDLKHVVESSLWSEHTSDSGTRHLACRCHCCLNRMMTATGKRPVKHQVPHTILWPSTADRMVGAVTAMREECKGHDLTHNYPNLTTCFHILKDCVNWKQRCTCFH